ncbi:MAG: formate dehydrogenase accessory sulfurtransferase FdhD [Spirochaetes bacterium]|nr:formate dehydrogenase accessory sulfurtransferase FdhD [Spirochaetota bacterium]
MVEEIDVTMISERERKKKKDLVVREYSLSILLNREKLITLVCTQKDLPALAVGHLFAQGFISGAHKIGKIEVHVDDSTVSIQLKRYSDTAIETAMPQDGIHHTGIHAGGINLRKVRSDLHVPFHRLTEMIARTEKRCEIFRLTGGTHACALSDMKGVFLFSEDIGRHNAMDRVIGRCLLDGVLLDTAVVFTTGRVSSSILIKAVRAGIPVLVSYAAPTLEAIRLAEEYGITLAGFAREGRMNVYANGHRID